MSLLRLLAELESADFQSSDILTRLPELIETDVACIDVRQLTRCGGRAADPRLVAVEKIEESLFEFKLTIRIEFSDGAALDCSGQCGGETVQRQESLIFSISKKNGVAQWTTCDGVISSENY